MSVIAHQTEKEWISANEKSRQRMSQTQLRAQQSNMQPDLRMHIWENIIRVLQYQKVVNQKPHICVKHDFVLSNHTVTLNLHSGTTQWKILGSGNNLVALHFKYDFWHRTAMAGLGVVQSGRPIFDDFFQHLWPYISNNTGNVVFQMVKRLWLIRIDQ
ncbi:adhesion G protein-coupled receptor B2 [Trichonephila clavipes]|nr:adhesion G protein-coupled receptor B2 [Trichonephila clavipes]